ncbi:hypothetical protein DRP05_11735 [Archaeoglobales archaeon]|nr:MAG: hypothetical protein DRP05_11735 [Archaeoglobales archaeon]
MEIEVIKVRLPLENAPDFANVYLVDTSTNPVLIDAGFISNEHAEELYEKVGNIKDVLITHHHIDHVGLVFWKEIDAYMNENDVKFLEMYVNPKRFFKPYMDWMDKYGIEFEFIKPLASALTTESKKQKMEIRAKVNCLIDEIFGFNVIFTPGHSPGHVCFYKDKLLFAGDLVLSDTTTHVGYYPEYSQNPMKDQIESLNKLLNLEIDVIYPAHEKTIKNPEKRISELIEHYRSRIDEVFQVLDEKPMKAVEVAEKVSWHRNFNELKGWDKLLAIGETLACLKYLVDEGKIKEVIINNTIGFSKI